MVSMNYTFRRPVKSKNNATMAPAFAMRVNRAAMRAGWLRTFGPIVGVVIVTELFNNASDKLRDAVYWEYCQPQNRGHN